MKILVLSDSHGNVDNMARCVEMVVPRHILHLGDCIRDAEALQDLFPHIPMTAVPGNCDFGASGIPIRQETLGGKRFYFTHGHLHGVKHGLYRLDLAAREAGADVVLFGHTHVAYEEYADGLYLFNPGSLGYDYSYGYVDVVGGGIRTAVVKLR